MTEHSPAKTGEYPRIFPNFQICARCEKDFKDNKDNSRHLGRKYARIFVLGHYLFLVALSFPRASLSENCSLLGTDNVSGQISEHIFAPNGDYCLFIIWQGKSERCDWFFLGRDFTIRTVSVETVQVVYFFFSKAGKFICSLNHKKKHVKFPIRSNKRRRRISL